LIVLQVAFMFDAASSTRTLLAEPVRIDDRSQAILDHPVLRLMPEEVQDLIRTCGQSRSLSVGECATGRAAVGFVLDGALAAFDRKNIACVGLHGRGSMFGWEASLSSAFFPVRFLPLLDTRWIEVPADELSELMGQNWLEHVFARHALDRLARVQAEAACNAVHQIPHRAANWIFRLYQVAGPELRTTQAILAQAMGVQRTSVNAAVKALERDGAIRLSRGRLIVTDPARLERFACGC
jgi:CRP-like cAMP-binding protein